MELHKETKAIGDKLVALHGKVEAGEASLKEADKHMTVYEERHTGVEAQLLELRFEDVGEGGPGPEERDQNKGPIRRPRTGILNGATGLSFYQDL